VGRILWLPPHFATHESVVTPYTDLQTIFWECARGLGTLRDEIHQFTRTHTSRAPPPILKGGLFEPMAFAQGKDTTTMPARENSIGEWWCVGGAWVVRGGWLVVGMHGGSVAGGRGGLNQHV
jgi:hypothetical protein